MSKLMGFECVVRALRSDYMVRRPEWPPEEHLEIQIINSRRVIVRGPVKGCFWEYQASSPDILAEDWERYGGRQTT